MEENISSDSTQTILPSAKPHAGITIVLIILVILSLTSTGFLAYQNMQLQQQLMTQVESQASTSLPGEATPTSSSAQPKLTRTFQQILHQDCRKIGNTQSYFYGIEPEKLPVSLNLAILNATLGEQGTVTCMEGIGQFPQGNAASAIITLPTSYVNIYDRDSKDLAHGGPSFFGSLPTIVGTKNNITFSLFLSRPEGGDALVGQVPVVMRGEKSLELSNGETVFANINLTAIPSSDPRLYALLDKNAQESTMAPGWRMIPYENYDYLDAQIAQQFFANMNALSYPESGAVAEIEKILGAITAK